MRATAGRLLAVVLLWALGSAPARAQPAEHHGADSTFVAQGLTVMWAVLRGQDEESTQVHLLIVKSSPRADAYRSFTVLSADPFSGEIREELRAAPLKEQNRIVKPRSAYQYFSSQRLLFYAGADPAPEQAPDLTIYYLGVPDTSPEFNALEDLDAYFRDTLRRLSGR